MNESNYCGTIDVYKIVKEYLKNNGFDGLYFENECGCELPNIAPCGELGFACEPGHKIPTPKNHDLYGEADWVIGPKDNPPPRAEKKEP